LQKNFEENYNILFENIGMDIQNKSFIVENNSIDLTKKGYDGFCILFPLKMAYFKKFQNRVILQGLKARGLSQKDSLFFYFQKDMRY
jgi:hypothetical protein